MRLGDLDALFAEIENDYKNANGMRRRGLSEALDSIADAPTIDAVPVVRCHECKHRREIDCPMFFVQTYFVYDDMGMGDIEEEEIDWTRDDGFCDRGERKEGEG